VGAGVPLEEVLKTLRRHGVDVARDTATDETILSKDGIVLALYLPHVLDRRIVHAIYRSFGIPLQHLSVVPATQRRPTGSVKS
jgi:hypothetical protein